MFGLGDLAVASVTRGSGLIYRDISAYARKVVNARLLAARAGSVYPNKLPTVCHQKLWTAQQHVVLSDVDNNFLVVSEPQNNEELFSREGKQ